MLTDFDESAGWRGTQAKRPNWWRNGRLSVASSGYGTRRSALEWVVCLVVGAVVLVGCEFTRSERADPTPSAERLAAGLEARDLGEVLFVDGVDSAMADIQLAEIVDGLGESTAHVSLQAVVVDEGGDRATATLRTSWNLGPDFDEWVYETQAELILVDGTWRVSWSPSVVEASLEPGQRLNRRWLDPHRGQILDGNGVPIVTPRPVLRIGIDKPRITEEQESSSADALTALLGLDDAELFRDRVIASGPLAFVEAIVVRADGSYPIDEAALDAIPGAVAIPSTLPLAPTREFARPILGSVGPATAELITESGGRLRDGDLTGLSGMQLAYDEQLSGRRGVAISVVGDHDATGGTSHDHYRSEPVAGQPIQTTLDTSTQLLAEQLLSEIGPPSALVAMRPSTGAVLAAASGPGSQGYSTVTLGQYPPGSTFKVISALALLRSGLTEDSELDCTDTVTVDGRVFKNYDDYPASKLGVITLQSAIANSCNTALIDQRDRTPQRSLNEAAAALGLGNVAPLGVPYFEGSVPSEAEPVAHAASMIGQDRILVSPLAMATVAASVAAGAPVSPVLVETDRSEASSTIARPVTADEAARLAAMMRSVVTDGSATFLLDVAGPDVAAKTGTAEYGSAQPPATHAWIIAIQGDLAVSVFVEDGAGGARSAGPILEEFLRNLPVT